ncbi:hypothetical protein M9H77_25278 [Catharanthus roseus]|uniref:Uncharacterized protein n=1 Tax=Catharanthus roseus TaxID=4058 RepID=A0ACC0A6F6_CATRO|nr:hypothetical protein M9H77_25278 [Catharanthus roseus]
MGSTSEHKLQHLAIWEIIKTAPFAVSFQSRITISLKIKMTLQKSIICFKYAFQDKYIICSASLIASDNFGFCRGSSFRASEKIAAESTGLPHKCDRRLQPNLDKIHSGNYGLKAAFQFVILYKK